MGLPFLIKAMLIVNCPFLDINSLVPSNGSTSQKVFRNFFGSFFVEKDSSAIIGILVASFLSAEEINSSDSRSAFVTGD